MHYLQKRADKDKVVWVGGWGGHLDAESRLLVVVVDHWAESHFSLWRLPAVVVCVQIKRSHISMQMRWTKIPFCLLFLCEKPALSISAPATFSPAPDKRYIFTFFYLVPSVRSSSVHVMCLLVRDSFYFLLCANTPLAFLQTRGIAKLFSMAQLLTPLLGASRKKSLIR